MQKNDLTIIYYTANRIAEPFAQKIRQHLHQLLDGRIPVISVSQEPIPFGQNICLGQLGHSAWLCYHQILVGAKAARTPFIACAEDDSLYTWEHFQIRPFENVFYYNKNRWIVEDRGTPRPRYRWRNRTGMVGCIAPRDLMISTLESRFKKFPDPILKTYDPRLKGWGEPGRYEGYLRLPKVGIGFFETLSPILTFNHKKGLGGLRRPASTDIIKINMDPWGSAKDLWDYYHG